MNRHSDRQQESQHIKQPNFAENLTQQLLTQLLAQNIMPAQQQVNPGHWPHGPQATYLPWAHPATPFFHGPQLGMHQAYMGYPGAMQNPTHWQQQIHAQVPAWQQRVFPPMSLIPGHVPTPLVRPTPPTYNRAPQNIFTHPTHPAPMRGPAAAMNGTRPVIGLPRTSLGNYPQDGRQRAPPHLRPRTYHNRHLDTAHAPQATQNPSPYGTQRPEPHVEVDDNNNPTTCSEAPSALEAASAPGLAPMCSKEKPVFPPPQATLGSGESVPNEPNMRPPNVMVASPGCSKQTAGTQDGMSDPGNALTERSAQHHMENPPKPTTPCRWDIYQTYPSRGDQQFTAPQGGRVKHK